MKDFKRFLLISSSIYYLGSGVVPQFNHFETPATKEYFYK